MWDDEAVVQVLEIAGSGVPLLERSRALVESLRRLLPVDAVWLTLSDPGSQVYATAGSAGLARSDRDRLGRPDVARDVQLAVLDGAGADLLARWPDDLVPAGFEAGLGVPLREPGGPCVGTLSLLLADRGRSSTALCRLARRLAPLVAQVVSPVRSVLRTAGLVDGASCGAVLLRDGSSWRLPELGDHPLLDHDTVVIRIARESLAAGHVYRSFLWPVGVGPAARHARVTVLAATDAPGFVLGSVLVTPGADCRGLTPRELEVLGLVVDGRSNQQIARSLTVAPRTVATHVEHILDKLQAATRTVAAVQAERDGCHVPPGPSAALAREADVLTGVPAPPRPEVPAPSCAGPRRRRLVP